MAENKPVQEAREFGLEIIAVIVRALACGVTLFFLWQWFAAPLGAHPITLLNAIGVALMLVLVPYIAGGSVQPIRTPYVFYPLIPLLIGLIVHLVMRG